MPGRSCRLIRTAAVVAWVAGGCRFHADYDGTEYLCADGVCPAGKTCIDGRCVDGPAAADAAAGADAADPIADAAIPVAACGTVTLLADDFEDGLQGPEWADSYENVVTLAETGGQLVLTIPGAGATGSAAYLTDSAYDLRGSRISVELVTPGDPATDQEAWFLLRADVDDRVTFKQVGAVLQMYYRDEGVQGGLYEVPFSATDHRFLALSERDGTVYWEVSADGTDWQELHSGVLPVDVSLVQVQVGAADFTGSTSGGTIRFDDVNGGGPPSGRWCPASSFADGFDDGVVAPWVWSQSFDNTGCTLDENGGQAVVDLSSGSTSHCAFYSATSFDLRDDAIWVEVPQMVSTSMTDVRAYLRAWVDSANHLDILQEDGTLSFRSQVDDVYTVHDSTPWSASSHRFWRIRESAGTVYWETSPDGAVWTRRAEVATPIDVSAVQIGLGGQALTAPTADPGHIRFDRYNQP